MPLSWANALAPTIALFACTAIPVMEDTRREDLAISLYRLMLVIGISHRLGLGLGLELGSGLGYGYRYGYGWYLMFMLVIGSSLSSDLPKNLL
jgi:hypothetical protein